MATVPGDGSGSNETDRCRLAVGGGAIGSRGEPCTGGAAFGPVEMTVPGVGKNGTGGDGVSG